MSERTRRPAVFRFDDPAVVAAAPVVVPLAEPASLPEARTGPPETRNRANRAPWAAMFWIGVFGLAVLATGLAVVNLIEDLASRAAWLGGAGLVLAVLAGVALSPILAREAIGLARLAERELMAPLDEEARRLVTSAAKRVSVVTAVSPRAAIDVFFVLLTALGLVRKLALLYGGRPGTLGLVTLMRHAVSHLALTGGMAASDTLIQQVIGHGLAAKLSARLGEGVLNGLLTARLGLAAIEATRPLPFAGLRQPALNDLAGSLLRGSENRGTEEALQDKRSP